MLLKLGFAAAGLMLLTGSAHAQENTYSANWALPGCRNLLQGNNSDLYRQGHCSGVLRGIIFAASDICLPAGVTGNQMVAVVVRYADQQPQRWHEFFAQLAQEALLKTWPCRR
jgi:hypothetical protein